LKIINKLQYWLSSDKNSGHVRQRLNTFILLTAAQNILLLDKSAKCKNDICYDMEPIVASQWQH